jgi:hypothetical protein
MDPRVLKPEELVRVETEHGLTLLEASEIVRRMDQDSSGPFDPVEREAIVFLGAAWKSGIITQGYFDELIGRKLPH